MTFQCDECKTTFQTFDSFNEHQIAVHYDEAADVAASFKSLGFTYQWDMGGDRFVKESKNVVFVVTIVDGPDVPTQWNDVCHFGIYTTDGEAILHLKLIASELFKSIER